MSISREAFPVVEMHLRGMGEVMSHAVMLHADELGEVAQAAVKDAIKDFDWRERIEAEVHSAIERQIKSRLNTFLWSAAGTALIDGVIARAIDAAFGSEVK